MSIIQFLKNEHKILIEIMDKLEKAANETHRNVDSLFKQFKETFNLHDKAEDEIVYPALKEIKELHQLILKSYQAHHTAHVGILELKLLPFNSESWGPKFSVVKDSIRSHIDEEENVLFPQVEKLVDNKQLNELVALIEAQRK